MTLVVGGKYLQNIPVFFPFTLTTFKPGPDLPFEILSLNHRASLLRQEVRKRTCRFEKFCRIPVHCDWFSAFDSVLDKR